MSKVICVLGMHRSGTSMFTNILGQLGVYLGPSEKMLQAGKANQKGFWEHKRIVEFNEQLLGKLGGSWYRPPGFTSNWGNNPKLIEMKNKARKIINEEFYTGKPPLPRPLWGFKDPRTCILLPFWQSIVPEMEYVICFRNPIDIAKSLAVRGDKLSFDQVVDLWFVHVKKSIVQTSGCNRIFLFYEDLMEDPAYGIARLAGFLKIDSNRIFGITAESVDKKLYHHHTSEKDVLNDTRLKSAHKALYLATIHYAHRSTYRDYLDAMDKLVSYL